MLSLQVGGDLFKAPLRATHNMKEVTCNEKRIITNLSAALRFLASFSHFWIYIPQPKQ